MTEFACSYQSVKGGIKVHVKEDEKGILLEACVPQGVEKDIDISYLEMCGKHVKVV